MSGPSKSDAWVRTTIEGLAAQHFPQRAPSLETLVRRMAERHETAWKDSASTDFRPTAAMYALALRWALDKLGPTCTVCQGTVEVPGQVPPKGPSGPTLALARRSAPMRAGRNVPQDLALFHSECVPG